jgi:hypothetical protein
MQAARRRFYKTDKRASAGAPVSGSFYKHIQFYS